MQISLLIVDENWKMKENRFAKQNQQNKHNGQWQTD